MTQTRLSASYDYNGLCMVCGFKKNASQLRRRWDGFWVCDEDFEPRHSLDFYKTRNDTHRLLFTSPDDNNGSNVGPAINNLTHTTIPTPVSGL